MKPDQYQEVQDLVVHLSRILIPVPLPEFLRAVDRAEATGPILDPTLYRRGSGPLRRIKQLATALNTARTEILKVHEEIGKELERGEAPEAVATRLADAALEDEEIVQVEPEPRPDLQAMVEADEKARGEKTAKEIEHGGNGSGTPGNGT